VKEVSAMLSIDPASQSVQDNYKLLIGSIVPRPIAFVTTQSSEGVLNAAPFSFFNIVTANPPMVAVSVQRKPGGVQKDTARTAAAAGATGMNRCVEACRVPSSRKTIGKL
jgi:flavin reductase (DIM6/NTAB) family NADH-FMN oxidoreductase RutF